MGGNVVVGSGSDAGIPTDGDGERSYCSAATTTNGAQYIGLA